jgi:hypothetical protein
MFAEWGSNGLVTENLRKRLIREIENGGRVEVGNDPEDESGENMGYPLYFHSDTMFWISFRKDRSEALQFAERLNRLLTIGKNPFTSE